MSVTASHEGAGSIPDAAADPDAHRRRRRRSFRHDAAGVKGNGNHSHGRARLGEGTSGGGGGDIGGATAESLHESPHESLHESLHVLPLWEHRPGAEPRQYVVDRGTVRLLSPEEEDAITARARRGGGEGRAAARGGVYDADADDAEGRKEMRRRRVERFKRKVKDAFFPSPNSVSEEYWDYARYRFGQRIAASCMSVFATQQMLQAIGLGAKRGLPAAAAVNWVLKDGLGRLGKLSVAANFGRAFDSDVKRFRFTSSVVFDCSALVEFITPFFPQHFLLLATIANVGKSVGITTANACRGPIQRAFALEENLGEVAAKTSAQQVLADNIGLAMAVTATGITSKVAANSKLRLTVPLVAFFPLAAMDLFCVYHELKCVCLRTINKERGEIIAERFVEEGRVPSHRQVSDVERLLIPARMDESSLPLKITHIGEACPTPEALAAALCGDSPSRPYVLTYLPYTAKQSPVARLLSRPKQPMVATKKTEERSGKTEAEAPPAAAVGGVKRRPGVGLKGSAYLALGQHASSRDVMHAVLQVAHLRHLPFRRDLNADAARRWALEESGARAARDIDAFMGELEGVGWTCGKVLLSSAERAPYRVEPGADLATRVAQAMVERSEGGSGGAVGDEGGLAPGGGGG